MVWVSCPSMRCRKILWCFKLSLMSTQISENRKISNSGQLWASDGRIFRQFPVLTHNFLQPVTRRAPTCQGCLRALRVIRRQGQTGAHTDPDKNVNFRHVWWDFSRACCYFSTGPIFSNTTGSDLSNGVGLVSVYALLKELWVLQAQACAPKSRKTWKSRILASCGPLMSAFFANFLC